MSETIFIEQGLSKEEKYQALLPQIKALINGETNLIACSGNACAALKDAMGFFWVGFYFVNSATTRLGRATSELILGPFQGPVACMQIAFGKGVCGTAWKEKKTIIVKDVDTFPGHIACSSFSKSEIVIPLFKNNEVVAVLDVDSETYACFDDTDKVYLEKLVKYIEPLF